MNDRTIRRTAHDSGDGATVRHCPMCGGGQVVGRSDGTIECEYCGTAFTVQVQPMYSGFPQTDANGMPIAIPGMPGEIGPTPEVPGIGDEDGNPFADDAPPGDQDQAADAPFPPNADAADDGDAEDDGGDTPPPEEPPAKKPKGGKDKPPAKKSSALYATASGARLSADAYARHLAIRHARPSELEGLLERFRTGDK